VVPHHLLSLINTVACLQLAARIPGFALQEYPKGELEPPKSEIVKTALRVGGRCHVIRWRDLV
jgi:galactonate dehydratase